MENVTPILIFILEPITPTFDAIVTTPSPKCITVSSPERVCISSMLRTTVSIPIEGFDWMSYFTLVRGHFDVTETFFKIILLYKVYRHAFGVKHIY